MNEEHYKKGTLKYMEAHELEMGESEDNDEVMNTYQEAALELTQALSMGLPEEDEINAKTFLGSSLIAIAYRTYGANYVASSEASLGAKYIEQAIYTDNKGRHNIFLKGDHAGFLFELDSIYYYNIIKIKETDGIEAAISYGNEKFSLFNYFPENPFLYLLLQLGNLYAYKGDRENAITIYEAIINSKFWDIDKFHKQEYDQIKITAKQNLNVCKRQA